MRIRFANHRQKLTRSHLVVAASNFRPFDLKTVLIIREKLYKPVFCKSVMSEKNGLTFASFQLIKAKRPYGSIKGIQGSRAV